MRLQSLQTIRLSLGVTASVALGYGIAWTLYFIAPIFTSIFLGLPVWVGWKAALRLLLRLLLSLLLGLLISEVLLDFPLVCVPVYGMLFFFIYYNDTPAAPPMSTLFMTLGVTMVPIMGLSGSGLSHLIAAGIFFNMLIGLLLAWIFHSLLPNSLASAASTSKGQKQKTEQPALPEDERIRLALVSTIVALSAVVVFFSLNLAQYALAMIYICFMAGSPSTNASIQVTKANALATSIGGLAIILVFNILVAAPTYLFLIASVLCTSLVFSHKIYSGGSMAPAFNSGFTTFLVLLGSSTGVDKVAAENFYLRIAQVLFAGVFTLMALRVVEFLLRKRKQRT